MGQLAKTTFDRIAEKSGRKPSACSCESCKNQCRTPCIGTPEDIERLIEAGYTDRLAPTLWAAGIVMGVTDKVIRMVQPKREDNGWCTFRTPEWLCELHDKGLKPTEGRLSHHSLSIGSYKADRNLTWLVARQWLPFQLLF